MNEQNVFVLAVLCVFVLVGHVELLSEYCSRVNRQELLGKLENCTNVTSSSQQTTRSSLDDLTTTTFTTSTASKPNNNNNQNNQDVLLKERYNRIVQILENVLASINDGNSTKNETIHLFMDIVELVTIANAHSKLQFCLVSICSLFKNCEFPIDIEYGNFESDARVASRIAALLTSITFNEKIEAKSYLSKSNTYAIARLGLSESENIYDIKIIFPRSADQDRFMVHGTKDLKNKIIEIKDFQQIIEDSKNFQWYNKWIAEKKLSNYTTTNWIYRNDDLKKSFDPTQVKLFNSMAYPPTTLDLNSQRFATNITYDCLIGIWNKVISVPFIYPGGDIRGVVSISISLNNFDLKQCDNINGTLEMEKNKSTPSDELAEMTRTKGGDPFYGTDKCQDVSTECLNIQGRGFVLGSYECKCRDGFYRPTNDSNHISYDKYSCLRCADGCETCNSSKPCLKPVPESLKRIALIINLICILICLILVFLTWYHMTLKILKTSSPKMLFIVLFGAIVSYSEIIPMYFAPTYWTCTAAQVLQLEGFLLAYGALVLKTWRECKLFYVRSVKTIKITDKSLLKRLGIIMLIGTTYLIAWAVRHDSPRATLKYDPEGLKYDTCTITEWNFISMLIQLAILVWGAFLSIQVRRASIAFKETKLITWAIFNQGVVLFSVIAITVILENTKVSSYVPFLISFVRIHLTITVMLLLLFTYKIYTIILARKKPLQASQQASGLLNSFSISGKDGEQKSSTVNDETDKERELKIEILRLYRQIEEMRSLSMRIANPHLIPKKSRFGYPTKKSKFSKTAKSNLQSDNELSKAVSIHEPELQSLIISESNQPVKPKKLIPIEQDYPSNFKANKSK